MKWKEFSQWSSVSIGITSVSDFYLKGRSTRRRELFKNYTNKYNSKSVDIYLKQIHLISFIYLIYRLENLMEVPILKTVSKSFENISLRGVWGIEAEPLAFVLERTIKKENK